MLGMSLGAAAQNYGDTYTIDRGGKSCSEWVSQFTSEVQLLESEVSSLKARVKTDGSNQLKRQLKEKQAEQKLEKARQDLDKALADVDKARANVNDLQNSSDISQTSIRKAREQKAAARKMVRDHVMVRSNGKSGSMH